MKKLPIPQVSFTGSQLLKLAHGPKELEAVASLLKRTALYNRDYAAAAWFRDIQEAALTDEIWLASQYKISKKFLTFL